MILETFGDAWYISLEHREDRRKLLLPELVRVGLMGARYFPAIKPVSAPAGKSVGKWGCKQSHLELVRGARQLGLESVLLMEDDVVFRRDFVVRWPYYAKLLLKIGWDIFTFGAKVKGKTKLVAEGLMRVSWYTMGHCYAVHHSAYDRYICEMGKDARNHDLALRDMAKTWTVLAPTPFLAWQRDGYSDLERKMFKWSEAYQTVDHLRGFDGDAI